MDDFLRRLGDLCCATICSASQLVLQTFGKLRGFVRHFAGLASEVQRVAHEDTRDAMFSANFPQPSEIVATVRAHQSEQRLPRHLELVGNCKAHSFSAIVNCQNSARLGIRCCRGGTPGNGTRSGCCHLLLLYAKPCYRPHTPNGDAFQAVAFSIDMAY